VCNPLAIISGGVQVAGAIAGHASQNKQAKANKALALQDLSIQYSDLNARAIQEQATSSRASGDVSAQAGDLRSNEVTTAAAGNISGSSVTAVLQDIARQEATARDTISANLGNTLDQIQRSKRGAQSDAINRINGVQRASIIGTGLRIGGDVLGTIDHYKAK
jgi:hypothetical protein